MKFKSIVAGFVASLFAISPSFAGIVSVAGPNSTAGFAPEIINPPQYLTEDNITNSGIQGFTEAEGVLLIEEIITDQGYIASGTRVDSHILFLNSEGNQRIKHEDTVWTFTGNVLGTQSDGKGNLMNSVAAHVLRHINVTYDGPFRNQGFEPNQDFFTFLDNQLTLTMEVTEPGDWMRVITASEVPLPGALWLMLLGLSGFGFANKQ